MKIHISFTLLVVFGASLFNTGMIIAQDESLPRSDPPVKIIKPDRASIERIRAEFERLPTNLEVTYDSKENDQVGGFSVFAPPKYLSITLTGAAAQFVKGKGLRENDLHCEPIFALTPYLDTSREKEAFVILMALTREFYAHRAPLSSALPFGKGYEPAAWQASKSELIAKLRVACAYCLEYGADTGWRRKYDVADLALERLPSTSTAKFDTAGAALQDHWRKPAAPDIEETSEAWVKERSAGLITDQKIDPESNEPRGTVTAGNLTIDLGETPPVYRHQLRTLECPIMLGDKHQRRSYEIYVTSFLIEMDGITKKYPLHVTYPRWVDNGIQTSGGFVFVKNENPVTKIGVILPKVKIPGDMGPGATELLEWQILVRVNDRSYVDAKTLAKEQTLGSDMVVLMPTHPDKIPASLSVVWFKFEKDGTVSLLDD